VSSTLSPAQKSWRARVFAATWLSYFAFYFCRKPFTAAKSAIADEGHFSATTMGDIGAAYLVAYAIGQFLAAGVGGRFGARINVLVGSAVSVLVTLAMGLTMSPGLLAGLVAINGVAQATGWSGNVGTMAAWFHRKERGRVMGVWSTNFTVGSLVSTYVMAAVLHRHAPGQPPPWRDCFTVGAVVLAAVWILYFLFQRNRPEDLGLDPIDEPPDVRAGDVDAAAAQARATTTTEATTTEDAATEATTLFGIPRAAWTNLSLIAAFYFCVKLIRYAIWSWAAFFLKNNYGLDDAAANTYSTVFEVLGIVGVWTAGTLSDRVFSSRRAEVALLLMFVMTAACGALMAFGGQSVVIFAVLLGVVGFSLFGPDALLSGAGAMDVGSKKATTVAAAIISGFGSLGPIVQELVIGRLYDKNSGNLTPIFALLLASSVVALLTMVVAVVRNRRGHRPL
jgi:sugar phosphate permease